MIAQDPGDSTPNQGPTISWGFHYPPSYDPQSNCYGHGLYYLGQSAKTGYFYFGGENARVEESVSPDDSFMNEDSMTHLLSALPQFFGKDSSPPWRLVSARSGIMGFSFDGLPLVGRLSSDLSGRIGNGEWIAAGFNGYGMANCLMSGEGLTLMMLGKNVSHWLPSAYGTGEKRLGETLTVSGAIKGLSSKL